MKEGLGCATTASRRHANTKGRQTISRGQYSMGNNPVSVANWTQKSPKLKVRPNGSPLHGQVPGTILGQTTMVRTVQTTQLLISVAGGERPQGTRRTTRPNDNNLILFQPPMKAEPCCHDRTVERW